MVLKTGDVHSTLVAKRFLGRSSEVVGALLQVRLGALQASCSSFLFFPRLLVMQCVGGLVFFLVQRQLLTEQCCRFKGYVL